MLVLLLVVAGFVPLAVALRANWRSSLAHALGWAVIAWLAWGVALTVGDRGGNGIDPARYVALCLTGCAGVAVLGARRPHVFAWNFVVLGLFAVMVLPLLETLFLGIHPVDGLRIAFLAATLAVGILNYLPTRFAPVVYLLLPVGGVELLGLYAPRSLPYPGALRAADGLLLLSPWLAWICAAQTGRDRSAVDRLWLSFRNRWGLFWGQRVREQFNHAAEHAGWPVRLHWQGLMVRDEDAAITLEMRSKMEETLRAALQRFIDPLAV